MTIPTQRGSAVPHPTPAPENAHVKPFAAYLTATNSGKTHLALSEKLHDVAEAVLRTGKPGTITLTVKIDADDVDSRRLAITETVAAKLPVGTAKKSVFWADDDGNLVRTDPTQLSFGDIRSADAPTDRRAQ